MPTKRLKPIPDCDWNFDSVPDDELVACCYWEYARESVFIVGLRQRSLDHWLPLFKKPRWWNEPEPIDIKRDLDKVRSIGHPAEYFLPGFACPPDGVLPDAPLLKKGEVHRLTGSFPKPWLSLTLEERKYRTWVPPRGLVDHVLRVPFERASSLDARDIVESLETKRRLADRANARSRRKNPKLTDDALSRMSMLEHPNTRPSLLYAQGLEQTVVEINWGLFTNEEIVQSFREWVKDNRPKGLGPPDGKGRNKARDWRVALERLAMARLLHQFRLSEMRSKCPASWKLYRKRDWYKERKKAGEMFRRLFPFLGKSEQLLSWPTRGGRSR